MTKSKNEYFLGANMNVICPNGRTSFGAAAQFGNIEILQLLLNRRTNNDCIDEKNYPHIEPKVTESTINRVQSEKRTSNSNLGYYVYVHSEQSSFECSNMGSDCKVDNLNKSECNSNIGANLNYSNEECNDFFLSKMKKTAYDLATFNDPCVRRDPRFNSKKSASDLNITSEDGETTPEGMDKLEWDMEVKENNILVSSDVDDPWCEFYYWYTSILLQTDYLLKEKPSAIDIDREDQFGCRALHYATVEGHIEAVKLLISAGND